MFKKAFKVSSNNSLSGKDKKKLASDLQKYFDPETVNIILEKNNPIVTVNKLQGSKIQIFYIGDVPLFVDATGKGDVFPTSTLAYLVIILILNSLCLSTIPNSCQIYRDQSWC